MANNIRINVIVNIIRTFVLTLLSFITFPWVCRALGDSVLGAYTWANTFVAYFLILAKIGLPNLAIRECVKVREDKEKLSNRVQLFFIIQLIMSVVSFSLLCSVIFTIPAFFNDQSLILILSLNFLAGAFSFEWVFIALEKQFYMSVRSIVTLAIAALLIVIFVTTPSDVYIYALCAVSVTIFSSIANMIYLRKFISLKKTMPYSFKEYIKPLSILFALTLCLALYNQTDTFILGFLDPSKAEVGSYSVGVKGVDVIIGIITALSTVFIPRAAFYYSKENKRFYNNLNKYSINICLFIVIPAVITMIILAKPICGLISGNYSYSETGGYLSAPYVLMILASMMITYTLADIIYGQILLPMQQEKHYLIALFGGTIINVGLSLLLGGVAFKNNPSIGVAIGTAITDVFILIYLLIIAWKWIKPAIFNYNSLKIVIIGAILVGTTIGLNYLCIFICKNIGLGDMYTSIVELIAVVLIDALIYIGGLRLLKEDLIMSFTKYHKVEENYNKGQWPDKK